MRTLTRIAAVTAASAACTLAAALPAAAAAPGPGVLTSGGEGPVFITVVDATAVEGDHGTTQLVFPVKLSRPSGQPLEIVVKTYGALSPSAADAGVDYEPLEDQRVFAPGTTELGVAVAVKGDPVHEPGGDEIFDLTIDDSSAGVISDGSAWGRIQDDDPIPTLSVGDVAAGEGTGGPTGFHFPLSLSNPSDEKVSVDLSASPGSAAEGVDWQAAPATVTFEPGQTAGAYTVSVVGDGEAEGDESFTVSAADPAGAQIGDGNATGTIEDDDDAVPPGPGPGPGGTGGPGSGGDGNGAGAGGAGGSPSGRAAYVPAGAAGAEPGDGAAVRVPAGDGAGGPGRAVPGPAAAGGSQPARAVAGLVLVLLGLVLLVLLLVGGRRSRPVDVGSPGRPRAL
ncbi:MAG: Calx-beta domain-containing protein [Actinomycetota bacterium]